VELREYIMCNYPDGYLTVYLLVYNAAREKQRYIIASATHYNAEAVEFDISSFTQTDLYLVFLFLVRHCHLHILYSIVFMVLCLCFSFKATRKCFITWVDVRQPPVSIVILL